jgi:NAD(P)-dependent dehydrogenase (short-subunit alcohol dehydrogenase family)
MKKPVCTLVGLTSKEGYHLAAQFARRGFEIAVICKKGRLFDEFRSFSDYQGFGFRPYFVNSDQPSYIENSIRDVRQSLGETDVLIYNDTVFARETNYPKYGNYNDIRLNSESALRAVNEVTPYMKRQQKGMIFFCGEEFTPDFGGQSNDSKMYACKWLSMKVAAEMESRNIQVYSCYMGHMDRMYNYNRSFDHSGDYNEFIRKSKSAFVYDNDKFYLNEKWFHQNYPTSGYEYPLESHHTHNYSSFWGEPSRYSKGHSYYPQNERYQNRYGRRSYFEDNWERPMHWQDRYFHEPNSSYYRDSYGFGMNPWQWQSNEYGSNHYYQKQRYPQSRNWWGQEYHNNAKGQNQYYSNGRQYEFSAIDSYWGKENYANTNQEFYPNRENRNDRDWVRNTEFVN